jgi:molybdopterin/thiamine biosynthesis adenylyltransferase
MSDEPPSTDRHHRQRLLPMIGDEGQRRLDASSVLVVGCGALGSVSAELLLRAGVGSISIVDRDVVEPTNLQRQTLFTESDARAGRPKAEAARERLQAIDSSRRIRGWVDDLDAEGVRGYVGEADLVVDGLDNFETRYLLNDACVERGTPYLYGGAVGTTGLTTTVLPARRESAADDPRALYDASQSTPCLRCVFPDPPPAGSSPTCDTAGVLGTVTAMVAARQATEAIKLLVGATDRVERGLWSIDPWRNRFMRVEISDAPDPSCPCCGHRRFDFLDGTGTSESTILCGRNAVQVRAASRATVDLERLRERLAGHGEFHLESGLLRGTLRDESGHRGEAIERTVFADGRSIVRGTVEIERARAIHARYVGA